MNIEDKDFKIGLLKEFWNKRNQSLVPAKESGMGIKKQKFLVFYNLIAKKLGEQYTLSNMKAFEQGPVYYDVYAYIKQTGSFLEQVKITPQKYSQNIINATLRLVESESYQSLSDITHALDFWTNKYDEDYNEEIIQQDYNYDKNNIYVDDITSQDDDIIMVLYDYYLNLYEHYNLAKIKGKIYAIEKQNEEKIKGKLISENPYIQDALNELREIDTVAKIRYNNDYLEDEMEGIIIDI